MKKSDEIALRAVLIEKACHKVCDELNITKVGDIAIAMQMRLGYIFPDMCYNDWKKACEIVLGYDLYHHEKGFAEAVEEYTQLHF